MFLLLVLIFDVFLFSGNGCKLSVGFFLLFSDPLVGKKLSLFLSFATSCFEAEWACPTAALLANLMLVPDILFIQRFACCGCFALFNGI